MAVTIGVALTWAAVIGLAAVLGFMVAICGYVVVMECRGCVYCRGLAQLQLWPRSAYVAVGDDEVPQALGPVDYVKMKMRWVGEATLMLMLPWVACIGSILLGHFAGAGWPMLTVYGLIVPFVVRMKAWEVHDAALLDGADSNRDHKWYSLVVGELQSLLHCELRLNATLGCLEVLDAVSDGAAVASAWLLDTRLTQHFHTAWQATPLIGPLAAGLGPVGCMAAALAFASVCQLGAMAGGTGDVGAARAAEVAGAGALAQRLISRYEEENPDESRGGTAFFVFVARVVGENAPQLLLQTSIVAAQGHGVLHDPVLVVSIVLSWGTMLKKYGEQLMTIIDDVRRGDCRGAVLAAVLTAPIPCMLAYIATKLYFVERCPSHSWGMSTGCVEF